jgi:mannose-6-phosphate isomerase-like protein (cupin superfamily)
MVEMLEQRLGVSRASLVELARTLPSDKWHEVARIRDATVYLVRAEPRDGGFDMHEDVDEFVVTLDGVFRVETPEGVTEAKAGECLLVPRGTRHRARLTAEAIIILMR